MRIKRTLVPIASVAVLIIAAYTIVHAYCTNCQPPGTPINCSTAATAVLVGGPFGEGRTMNSTGRADFVVTATSTTPTPSSTLQFQGFTGTGNDPELGAFIWSGNITRPTPLTTIVSNQADQDFPATGDILMHIDVTISARPGAVFRSMSPIHVHNGNLQTFAPHLNEVYNLTQPVNFEDAGHPGEIAFTLVGLTATLN